MQELPSYLSPGPSANSFNSTDNHNHDISCHQIKLHTRQGPPPAWFQQAAMDPSSYNFAFCTCAGNFNLQVQAHLLLERPVTLISANALSSLEWTVYLSLMQAGDWLMHAHTSLVQPSCVVAVLLCLHTQCNANSSTASQSPATSCVLPWTHMQASVFANCAVSGYGRSHQFDSSSMKGLLQQ